MSRARQGAVILAVLRIVYGTVLCVAPASVTKRWLGADRRRPATQVALRGLGARDALIHAGILRGALRDEPVRPWLAASVAGDCADIASTLTSADGLPDRAGPATAVVAGGAALLTAAVAFAVDR